jgi:hypothetical protein
MTPYPEPDIILEMPTPFRVRIVHAAREVRSAVAFICAAYRRPRASEAELKAYTQALIDGLTGGEMVEDVSYTSNVPVFMPSASGKSRRTFQPRYFRAFAHKRGPHFHSVRQA